MLVIAIVAILAVSLYSILKAPAELRNKAIMLMTVPPIAGFALLYFLSSEDERVYFGIAAAIGSWALGSNIYDRQRKKLNKAKGFEHE